MQDFCINPKYYDEISTVFDGWIDCIHDSTIQMDTDTDGCRYRYRWIQIQIWMDTDIDGYRYRWINCLISFGTFDLMGG